MKRLLVCLAFVAIGMTACGGDDTVAQRGDIKLIVASAPDKTKAADTAKMHMEFKVVGDSTESIPFDGAVDFGRQLAFMTLEIDDLESRIVFDKGVMYQRIPGANLPVGKEWVKFDFAELDRLAGGTGDVGFSAGQQDPTATLEQLREADDVTEVGSESVRGTQTMHYRAIVDLQEGAASGGLEAIQMKKMIDELHLETIPMDVWIDAEGRVWRISQEIDFSKSELAKEEGGPLKAIVSVEYFDFGSRVDIEVPSEGDAVNVLEVPELFE